MCCVVVHSARDTAYSKETCS